MDKRKEIDSLRERFSYIVNRTPSTIKEICRDIGISTHIYHNFINGSNLSRLTIIKIREFCDYYDNLWGQDMLH